MPHLVLPGQTALGGYTIDNSVWLDGSADYFSRTPSASNRTTFTISMWFKRNSTGVATNVFNASSATPSTDSDWLHCTFDANDQLFVRGWTTVWRKTNQKFRDTTGWYHLVIAFDTTNGTAADRLKVYLNGAEITSWETNNAPSASLSTAWNDNIEHNFARRIDTADRHANSYLAETAHVDGSALTPTSFGETDANGAWVPKDLSGLTWGTNGFWLDFSGTITTTVTDVSSNSNNWTSNSITAAQQVTDTPTSNFPTINPLAGNSSVTLSGGNLSFTCTPAAYHNRCSTVGMPTGSGMYYAEMTLGTDLDFPYFGLTHDENEDGRLGELTDDYTIVSNVGATEYVFRNNAINSSKITAWGTPTAGDILQIVYDSDSGKIFFGQDDDYRDGSNNASDPAAGTNPAFTYSGTKPLFFGVGGWAVSNACTVNFGQSGFTYTPPTGAVALNTTNLPAPAITDPSAHFQVHTYAGTGAAHDETFTGNSSMDPDLVWIKNRDAADEHKVVDSVRGATKEINSDSNNAESTDANGVDDLSVTNGFGLGTGAGGYNDNTENFVSWNWKANGAGAANSDGSITTIATSADTTNGFSIIEYTGTAANATIGHGLNSAPEFVLVKQLNVIRGWIVGHKDLTDWTRYLVLHGTDAEATLATVWNSTAPSSTVINLGTNNNVNDSGGTMVAYAWHGVEGYSKFGSYVGNGSADGPFVYTGFKPALVVTKNITGTSGWVVHDRKRDPHNVSETSNYFDSANAETAPSTEDIDFLANGFKIRSTTVARNTSASTYIYMAFAENPFGGTGVAPALAV